ncbi:MAG: thiamine-phosphate kinase, partial [Kiritimatiellae bacterium]|nr:thiamine-phosphate kinase [Kiritimatiellia bacterium]
MGEVAATLQSIGERGFIARLKTRLPACAGIDIGVGDDCAVVEPPAPGERLVLKSDPVSEGRHFLPGDDPRRIGRKALARVLSDFAAMGATPRWALADFAAPPSTPLAFAGGVFDGMAALARDCSVAIVGGDTSCADAVSIHVFCAGSVPAGEAMRRDGARPGDRLCLTGSVGASFQSGRHFDFAPRLAEGRWLRRHGVRCAIDVSDGLACEAWHLARASRVSIAIREESIPVSQAALKCEDPVSAALGDGEDFELLFAAPRSNPSLLAEFRAAFPD